MNWHARNFTPISPEELARKTGTTVAEVIEFFTEEFGSYEAYVQACLDKEPLNTKLRELNGDEP